jgi:hypothetical protein
VQARKSSIASKIVSDGFEFINITFEASGEILITLKFAYCVLAANAIRALKIYLPTSAVDVHSPTHHTF